MGFLDKQDVAGASGSSGKLNLVEYEKNFIHMFNDSDVLCLKYKAEEFGIAFDKKAKKSDVYTYEGSEEVTICPEPLEFIKEFDDVSDNTHEANSLFLEKIKGFQCLKMDNKPLLKAGDSAGERMWMNKTLTGINLRPGNLNDDRDDFTPVRMCDDNVHGLIVGRTGSGKSVYINALILTLITEYAPWELNLYLADFKKVELSRYMNDADIKNDMTAFTPHINACAATSEIRYVTSLIQYLVDCMNARQEFFARLGVTKIQEFRNKYNLVLPRVLLIVDEFQQLFTEATTRETEQIQTMLNSITKLGRATGFHLIFASQEMSGTLKGNTLANFKIRMALPCNQQISVDILGNGQAVSLERGYVLVNTDSGDELKNKKYRVPFIETDKKDDDDDKEKVPFYQYLDEIKLAGKKFDLGYKTQIQKFYREELQETENDYRNDLDKISEQKNKFVLKNRAIFDGVILGKSVLYSPLRNDKVSFYIERGRNKGIMIASPDPDNAARIRKLLAENLFRSNAKTNHICLELNNLVLERYRMNEAVEAYPLHGYFNCDIDKALEYMQTIYFLRYSTSRYLSQSKDEYGVADELNRRLIELLSDQEKVAECKRFMETQAELTVQIERISDEIEAASSRCKKKLVNPVIRYLDVCSSDIIITPEAKTKADLTNVQLYKQVVKNYTDLDEAEATKTNIELLDKKITELMNKNSDCKMNLAIQQNKVLRRALLFYSDKYNEKVPEKTKLSDVLDECYLRVQKSVDKFKVDYSAMMSALKENLELEQEKEKLQVELDELRSDPNEILKTEEDLKRYLSSFIQSVFADTFSKLGYKKNCPQIPEVCYEFTDGDLKWFLHGGDISEVVKTAGNEILDLYMNVCSGTEFSSRLFMKNVFWINGLDEFEKIPGSLTEMIKNAINLNILVIAIITSELKDTLIRKAFDYAFVTGNIEKFYSMFNIKYTKQPLDSIVINFGIRSKGFDIPFKMYKSNLEDIQSPDFIDQLLNE